MSVKKTANLKSKSPASLDKNGKISTLSRNEAVVTHLDRWFAQHARVLPWRDDPSPYHVWISEIMLQQTQVATVLPYFDRFLKRFPTVKKLADASIDEVYQLWAGLGYYSRARNLHKGAQFIAEHGFPKNHEEWLAVPGVGNYTAGAICSIALNQREPIVDGNVVRVLSRIYKIGAAEDGGLDAKFTPIWAKARELVAFEHVQPRALNQSLMELGALICKPKNPLCAECPVEPWCLGKKEWDRYPPPKAKKIWKRVEESKWILFREGKKSPEIYLIENKDTRWRKGLWDFPNTGMSGLKVGKLVSQFVVNYVVTNHKVSRDHSVLELSAKELKKDLGPGKWFALDQLPGVPSPVVKAIKKMSQQQVEFSFL